eukprot:jgi/Tetstr1/446096/TSEL_033696.t1
MSAPSADGAAERAVDPGSPPPPSTSSSISGSPGASREAGASPAAAPSSGSAPDAPKPRPSPPAAAAPPAPTYAHAVSRYAQAVSRSSFPESATGAEGTTGARAASHASSPRRSTFSSISGIGASQRDHDGFPTGQEVSERPQPRPRGGNRGLALTGLDALARLHSRLHDSGPARPGVAPAAAWTVADALSDAGVAAGAACAPMIDAAARSLQPARVRHHPADVVAFVGVAAAWLAKARAVLAERHRRRAGSRRAGGAGHSPVLPSPALPSVAAFRGVAAPPIAAPAPPEAAGDGVGWGAVDHLSDVDMVHMPAEMSMETAVPIEFQEAWAGTQRCVNERVVAAVEADDPVAFYAGHARQRRTDADLFAALLVGTTYTVVALVEDGEFSRAGGRLSSKGMVDLSDPAILAQLRDKHPSRSHPIPDAAYDIPVDEAALTVDMRVPYHQLKQHVTAGPSGMRNEYLRCLVGEYAPASGSAAVRAMSEVASMYLQGRLPGWFNRLFASARLVAHVKKLGEGRAPDVRHVAVGEAEWRAAERAVVDNMKEAYVSHVGVTDGAARFNADDGFLVGLPEHVWPALHAFRTSLKASVGLEVRFDKMQAYIADMEAARQYVQAYMRGKAEELREEVDASLSKLLSAKPSRRYITHALHHHAWAMIKHCMQHKAGYSLRNCLPSEVEAFAEAVDATVLAAVERVPWGFLIPPRTAPTPIRWEPGVRRMATVRDAAFIGCMNAILPKFLTSNSGTNTPTPGFFDPLLGYAAEMREEWGRLQAAIAGHLGDADARVMQREVETAPGSQKELTAFLDQANNSRLRNEVCALPATCRERILFNQLDAASSMWIVAIPTARTVMTPHELREVAAGYFFLPSPCLAPVVGSQIILPSTEHNPVTVDLYGDALMNLPAPGDAHRRVQQAAIADAFRDQCVHDLGIVVRREVDDLFQQAVPLGNTVPRDELKDLVPDAELSLPAFNVVIGSYDPGSLKSTLLEFKTMRDPNLSAQLCIAIVVFRAEAARSRRLVRLLSKREGFIPLASPPTRGAGRKIKLAHQAEIREMALSGKTYLVTGSTDGIGLFTAQRLAAAGGDVIVHGRSRDRVAAAVAKVEAEARGKAKVTSYTRDLASLREVRQLAADIKGDHGAIDVLVNNAGVYMESKALSENGFEMTYAVNVLAPFLLTALVHDIVTSKIVNTASLSAAGSLDVNNLNQERGFSSHGAYSLSKLCNIMFTFEMAERMAERPYTVNALDPGTVNTKMLLAGWGSTGIPVTSATNEFHLATGEDGVSGQYYVGKQQRRAPAPSYDASLRRQMWALWEEQTGQRFP